MPSSTALPNARNIRKKTGRPGGSSLQLLDSMPGIRVPNIDDLEACPGEQSSVWTERDALNHFTVIVTDCSHETPIGSAPELNIAVIFCCG